MCKKCSHILDVDSSLQYKEARRFACNPVYFVHDFLLWKVLSNTPRDVIDVEKGTFGSSHALHILNGIMPALPHFAQSPKSHNRYFPLHPHVQENRQYQSTHNRIPTAKRTSKKGNVADKDSGASKDFEERTE